MIQFFKKLFGSTPATDYKELVKNGAFILDVRTPSEYQSGHIKGSVNVPVQELSKNLSKIPKGKTIITCCASGMRSASARGMLKSNGYADVHNGGGWASLQSKIN